MHLIGNMCSCTSSATPGGGAGRFGFLAFYSWEGSAQGLTQWAAEPLSPIPTIGASGAIAAVMGGYLLLFPKARVDVLIFIVIIIHIIPVPAWIVLALWFVFQSSAASGRTPDRGVAYWAHAGVRIGS
jgi:membrane associated rhomboid family serine protease